MSSLLDEREESIIAICPSDSNLNIFPNNSPSSFTVQFQKPLIFKTPKKCCLFDIILPPCVNHLKRTTIKLVYYRSHHADFQKLNLNEYSWNFDEHVLETVEYNGNF